MTDKLPETIYIYPDYWPFNGQERALEKYLVMRLQDDIARAFRGKDPQVVWEEDALYDALHLVADRVREKMKAAEE